MTKAELIVKLQEKVGLKSKAEAARIVDNVLAGISDALTAGDKVVFSGFGTFTPITRKARPGRNPRTGDPITIPASKTVKFSPGKTLREKVK